MSIAPSRSRRACNVGRVIGFEKKDSHKESAPQDGIKRAGAVRSRPWRCTRNAPLSLFFVQAEFLYKNAGAIGEPRHRKKPTRLEKLLERLRSGWLHGDNKPPPISVASESMRVLRKSLEVS